MLTKPEKNYRTLHNVLVNRMGIFYHTKLEHAKIYSVGFWSDIKKFAPMEVSHYNIIHVLCLDIDLWWL